MLPRNTVKDPLKNASNEIFHDHLGVGNFICIEEGEDALKSNIENRAIKTKYFVLDVLAIRLEDLEQHGLCELGIGYLGGLDDVERMEDSLVIALTVLDRIGCTGVPSLDVGVIISATDGVDVSDRHYLKIVTMSL